MIIGGYALPLYGRIRTTIDIDIAVLIKTNEELNQLRIWLQSINFEMVQSSILNPLIVIIDQIKKIEIELWLKPDGIVFDEETLDRRRKTKLDEKIEAWFISPEDFIVNKLARPDRSVVDEQDVKSVLVRQKDKLDYEYLEKRAQKAGVLTILHTIEEI